MTDHAEKTKRPASQYYWGDWFRDLALQSCSLPARGLWHEMNCLMHQGEPYGHLTMPNGKPMAPQQLGNLCKISVSTCKKLLDELEGNGVYSKSETGSIFSRRMVRDEDIRNRRGDGGKQGAEHGVKGAESGSKGGRPRKPKGGFETPLSGYEEPPPSSSSSTSVLTEPKGSDGKPSKASSDEMSKTELWRSAVSLLGGQGMPESQARSLIGKLTKDYANSGDDIVLNAVRGAVLEQPADARAYLKATCQRLAGERKRDGSSDWTQGAL